MKIFLGAARLRRPVDPPRIVYLGRDPDGAYTIDCQYHEKLIAALKAEIGWPRAKWDAGRRRWVIVEEARQILFAILDKFFDDIILPASFKDRPELLDEPAATRKKSSDSTVTTAGFFGAKRVIQREGGRTVTVDDLPPSLRKKVRG